MRYVASQIMRPRAPRAACRLAIACTPTKIEGRRLRTPRRKIGAERHAGALPNRRIHRPAGTHRILSPPSRSFEASLIIQVSIPRSVSDFLIALAKSLPTFRYVRRAEAGSQADRPLCRGSPGLLTPMTGGGSRNLMNEMARDRAAPCRRRLRRHPGPDLDWFQRQEEGKPPRPVRQDAHDRRARAAHRLRVAKKRNPAPARRFSDCRHAQHAQVSMDRATCARLDDIFEVLRPYFRCDACIDIWRRYSQPPFKAALSPRFVSSARDESRLKSRLQPGVAAHDGS